MGDKQNQPFQLSFNGLLKIDFQGSRITSDGGLVLVRELDERLGFGDLMAQHLTDSRRGKNTQLPLADLLRQSVYSRIAGYEDVNDAERLARQKNRTATSARSGMGRILSMSTPILEPEVKANDAASPECDTLN